MNISTVDSSNCIGTMIKDRGYNMGLASGAHVYPCDLRPEDITLNDIARSLSRICRFGGHLKDDVEHYSVAQHSVLVSYVVPKEYAKEGLLHDATEAYVGDMIRPIKVVMPHYNELEHAVKQSVCAAFNLEHDYLHVEEVIKYADNVVACTEKRDVIPESTADWGVMPEPMAEIIKPLNAFEAYDLFMSRAKELGVV